MKILLIDRIGSFSGPLIGHWRASGHEVCVCRGAGEAVRILLGRGPGGFDLVFVDWCDQAAVDVSRDPDVASSGAALVVRLRSYERFTAYPRRVNWGAVNRVIFVHEHVMRDALAKHPSIPAEKAVVVHNGVDLSRLTFRARRHRPPLRLAWLGRIAPTKNLPLAFAVLDELRRRRPQADAKLVIGGPVQSGELYDYMLDQVSARGGSARYDGEVADVDRWLDEADVLLSTSVREGVPNAVLEAMAKGVKPVVHAWPGADEVFPAHLLWRTVDEAVRIILGPSEPTEYRRFVEDGYGLDAHLRAMDAVCAEAAA